MKKIFWLSFIVSICSLLAFQSSTQNKTTLQETVAIDTLASGLTVPWDICFLPTGEMLFTERNGKVRLYRNNHLEERPVLTIPNIEVNGKMGLLGMCLHPQFKNNHLLYLAYNYKQDNRTYVRVAKYAYLNDSLTQPVTVIENIPGVFNHTGCRLKFGPDQKLYITTGDADVPRLAEDLKVFNGKILRLNDDGSIPADNPYLHNDTARHEIWTYGHRNPQGIAFEPGTNKLYSSEHGPTGGDEINLITKGNNYGWPVIHHRDKNPAMMSPLMEFTPSIGPAEALFYSGKAFPSLKGNLLVGCMRGEAILNVHFVQHTITGYNYLLKNKYGRIRAIAEGPDGYIYFSTSQVDPPESHLTAGDRGYDMILRIKPSKEQSSVVLQTDGAMHDAIYNAANAITTTGVTNKTKSRNAATLYAQLCASCHGADMKGKENIPSLIDKTWINSGTKAGIAKSIREGIVAKGMPAWDGVLTPAEINALADRIMKAGKN
jgi:glucose/arabinose dehydrogenase